MSTSLTDFRLLGKTGLRVSPVCLGTIHLGEPTALMEGYSILADQAAQNNILV